MNHKLNADKIRQVLQDFLKPETDLLWQQELDVYVLVRTDSMTGDDTFRVAVIHRYKLNDNPPVDINSITINLSHARWDPRPRLSEFATTVRNQLRLML